MRKLLCFILSLTIILCSGCIKKKEQIQSIEKDYIIYNLGEFPEDLTMLDNDSIREKDVLFALFEGLVREDEFGVILPGLAESWTISKDGLYYSFKIRDDAKWSNGVEITAKDFVEFFSKVLNDETINVFAEQLYCIYGAKDYKDGKVDFDGVAINAVDDRTLQIGLNYNCTYFLNVLSQPPFVLRKLNSYLYGWQKYYDKIQYSGPFIIKNITQDDDIMLSKNEKYWREQEVKSDEILITSIKNTESALVEFEGLNSESYIDIFVDPPINERKKLLAQDNLMIIPSVKGLNLTFNMKKNHITNDLNFRKAISFVISKEYIIQNISKDIAVPASAYVPSIVNDGVHNTYGYKYYFEIFGNKDKGNEYFNQCEFDKSKKIKLVYKQSYLNKRICEAIAKNIKDYLDINVKAVGYDEEEFDKCIENGEYDIIQCDFVAEYDDIIAFYERWTSLSKFNKYGYNNHEFDKKILKASLQKNRFERKKLLEECAEILLTDMPTIPVYFYNTVICKREYVEGLYATKKGNIKLDEVYKNSLD